MQRFCKIVILGNFGMTIIAIKIDFFYLIKYYLIILSIILIIWVSLCQIKKKTNEQIPKNNGFSRRMDV